MKNFELVSVIILMYLSESHFIFSSYISLVKWNKGISLLHRSMNKDIYVGEKGY